MRRAFCVWEACAHIFISRVTDLGGAAGEAQTLRVRVAMRELPRELVDAAKSGNLEIVERWLDVGGDVNALHDGWDTLLKCAATYGRAELVRYLLSRGAKVEYARKYGYSGYYGEESVLHSACEAPSPDIEVLKLLISAGANINARVCLRTPLGEYLFNSSNPLQTEVVALLLRHGASLDKCKGTRGSAEDALERRRGCWTPYERHRYGKAWQTVMELLRNVRAAGGWKRFCRLPHKDVSRLAALVARGHAEPTLQTEMVFIRLFRLPHRPLRKVLEFWRAPV